MSFLDHDNCRHCGTPDGPSHATECDRILAQRREAQAAHDLASNPSLPVVVRKADGKRFRIVMQARSPDGPVDLVACDGPPFERASVSGLVFVHAYDDPRKAPPLPDPLAPSDRCGHAGPCSWLRAAVDATPSSFVRREMEHPDTLARVTRYVATYSNGDARVMRACPACGGNPNAEAVRPR